MQSSNTGARAANEALRMRADDEGRPTGGEVFTQGGEGRRPPPQKNAKFFVFIKPRRGGYQIAAPGNWVTPSVCLSVCLSEANRLPNYKCSMAELGIF